MVDPERIRDFYDQRQKTLVDDPEFLRGTVEDSRAIARFRYRAEQRHLARVLDVRPGMRVLDLGGGTGRWAVWFAQRGARVTMVEIAPSLAEGAARNAARLGLDVTCRVGSVQDPPLAIDERFDLVHIGGVLVYVSDDDLPRVAARVRAHTQSHGTLVLREPVDPNGPSHDTGGEGYEALFRRPEAYAQLFESEFELRYQRTTVSHLVPRGYDTRAAVAVLKGTRGLPMQAVQVLLPSVGYIDYRLLQLEEHLRASPLRALLGDPGVVQHFYLFRARS